MHNIRFLVHNRFQSYGSDGAKYIKQADKTKQTITTSKKGQGFGNLGSTKSFFGLQIFTKDFNSCFSKASSRLMTIDSQEQIMV